jgi:hypothetical protein
VPVDVDRLVGVGGVELKRLRVFGTQRGAIRNRSAGSGAARWLTKRANGEGNVRQRPNGTWEGRLSYIDPATDKRRSTSVYAATAAECRRELRKVRRRIEDGKPAKNAPDTVASWLAQWRESSLAASDRKATTKSLYGTLSRKHLA